jgi:2-C-methyl-D-erythritol 4-phosphate cytidylyltransferase
MTELAARCFALVPCAGVGLRAGQGGPKQYSTVAGRSVVAHTLAALAAVPQLTQTLVVLSPDDTRFEAHAPDFAGWLTRTGGATRADSVAAGLQALRGHGAQDHDWVLVHDAARCLLQAAAVQRLIEACAHDAVGGLLALPLADTLKAAGPDDRVNGTLDRSAKWLAQTPQMFRIGPLMDAIAKVGSNVTDEAGAMEAMGLHPRLVPGGAQNFKVTYPDDFALASAVLAARSHGTTLERFGGERGHAGDAMERKPLF